MHIFVFFPQKKGLQKGACPEGAQGLKDFKSLLCNKLISITCKWWHLRSQLHLEATPEGLIDDALS